MRVVNDIFSVFNEKDAVASIINYLIAIFEHNEINDALTRKDQNYFL